MQRQRVGDVSRFQAITVIWKPGLRKCWNISSYEGVLPFSVPLFEIIFPNGNFSPDCRRNKQIKNFTQLRRLRGNMDTDNSVYMICHLA